MASKFPLNPYFRSFIYDVLCAIPEQDKFLLKGRYYKIGQNNKKTKQFVDRAGYEEIMHVLTILGFEWFTVFYDKKEGSKFVRNVFDNFDDGDRVSELRKLIQRKIYITGGKQFIDNLYTAAQSTQTNVYVKNIQLLRAGYHLRAWPRNLNSKNVKEGFYNSDTLRYLSETVLHSILAVKQCRMPEADMWILLYCYGFKHLHIDYFKLGQKFSGVLSRYKIIASVTRLLESSYLQKHSTKKAFTITALGVTRVMNLVDEVLRENGIA